MNKATAWFRNWFNTPWYHILYKHRDYEEARAFIDNLAEHLQFHKEDKLLDLACGRGRHAIYLNSKGYDVTGLDLSQQSITIAKEKENERLHFATHDMRDVYKEEAFDYILNLFTSFGYFEDEKDNERVIQSISRMLKPGGKLVLDFLNAEKTIKNLRQKDSITAEGITFAITRKLENGFIMKNILFEAEGESHHYVERVKALKKEDFLTYFEKAGLEPIFTFGDYELNNFDPEQSDRLIFIAAKA